MNGSINDNPRWDGLKLTLGELEYRALAYGQFKVPQVVRVDDSYRERNE